MHSPAAAASRDGEGQASPSLLSNATIFARLNELDKWRQEEELDDQAWASELERQRQEDAMILEQRARIKEEFEQRKADRRQRVIQTRNEMDALLDALKTNLTQDLSDIAGQSLSNMIQGSPVTPLLQTGEEIRNSLHGSSRLEPARPVGSSFRAVNETTPTYRLSSGQSEAQGLAWTQKRRMDDTHSTTLPRQKRKYTRRILVSGGHNSATQGSSPAYHARLSAPEGTRGEQEGAYWCERRDEYNRGIWTHPVTGAEYFLECPKCQKREFKSLKGLKIHYTIEHERKGITVDNLELALEMYGVPVDPALQSSRMQREVESPQSKDQEPTPYLQQGRTTIGEIEGDMYSSDEPAENNDEEDSIAVISRLSKNGWSKTRSGSEPEQRLTSPASGGSQREQDKEVTMADPAFDDQTTALTNSRESSALTPQPLTSQEDPESLQVKRPEASLEPSNLHQIDHEKDPSTEINQSPTSSPKKGQPVAAQDGSDNPDEADNEENQQVKSTSNGWIPVAGSRRTTRARVH